MPTPTPKFEYNPLEIISRVVPTYDTTEGFRTKDGNLYFSDYPQFAPNLTPLQMIRAGVFGGCYFNPRGGRPGIISPKGIDINYKEFPSSWFAGLHESLFISRRYVIATNKYGVKAGQDQAAWEQSGWIHPQDPRGWFQWYCRFFMGRRSADDERQVDRWARCTGPRGRWKNALCSKIKQNNRAWDDASISPVIRQTLLHWAYELTKHDFNST